MSPFLSKFLAPQSDTKQPRDGASPAWALSLTLLGLVVVCVMAAHMASGAVDAAYRVTWIVFSFLTVFLFYRVSPALRRLIPLRRFSDPRPRTDSSSERPSELNSERPSDRRALLAITAVMAQPVLIFAFFVAARHLPGHFSTEQILLVLPYAVAPIVTSIMLNRQVGVFVALAGTFLGSAMLPALPDGAPAARVAAISCGYFVASMLAGGVATFLTGRVLRRERVLVAGAVTGVVVFVVALVLGALRASELASLSGGFHPEWLVPELLAALGANFLYAVIVSGLMTLLEKIFNISTPMTWQEWGSLENDILQRFEDEAPGTYEHSLAVKRIAEAAAERVGADKLRTGVCALYHDIGKLSNPGYFTENINDQSLSPHNDLTPEASARIIIDHVKEGAKLARANKLNERIIDVILEHHGVSTPYFFYRKALDQYNEAKKRFDEGASDTCPDEVDKKVFSYKGPIPQTRESGIVSLADAVESATRSLQHPSEEEIRSMIDGIFKGRILDGHLRDSGLTLGDIAILKESFFKSIKSIHHRRIVYPKKQDDDAVAALAEKRAEGANAVPATAAKEPEKA